AGVTDRQQGGPDLQNKFALRMPLRQLKKRKTFSLDMKGSTMKIDYCAMFVLVALFCGSATTKGISMNDLKIEIRDVTPSGSITVRVSNSSKDVIKLWKQSNSWGAACWRVLLVRN